MVSWEVILSAVIWIVWLECDKKVFHNSTECSSQCIYFIIYNLYKYWIDIPTNVEYLFSRVNSNLVGNHINVTGLTGSADTQGVQFVDDEDLLEG